MSQKDVSAPPSGGTRWALSSDSRAMVSKKA